MLKKLSTSFVVIASLVAVQLPFTSSAMAAEEAKQEKKKRPTYLVSPSVGKKIQKAFELYSAEVSDVDGALEILLDIEASKAYDKAYTARFIAVMYATKGKLEKEAIIYLEKAVAPDILSEIDHSESLRLLGQLKMQTEDYKGALVAYNTWLEFTGKDDANVYVAVAQAHMALKQLDKVIAPADKAIAAFGEKHNQNPYILKMSSYYERKKYKEAIDVLETVILIFPENKTWWTQLPMFYLLVEDYDRALQTLDLAYKQDYLDKESQIKTLASLYSSNGTPYMAAELLEKHIASGLVTRDDRNIGTLANAWHAAQHIGKAANYYGELAKMTNDAKHYRKQGMLLKQDNQFKKAVPALEKALKLGIKDKGRVYMSIAESHFYLEQYKLANVAIKKAMEDPKTRRSARSWRTFIVDTAQRKNVKL